MRNVTITSSSGQQLASGSEPEAVLNLEGNWYFQPSRVDTSVLEVTERTYTCPYKGTCRWVDYVGEEGRIPEVAWIYDSPKPGYEPIGGRYGFYGSPRSGTFARVKDA
ncbi:MAG: DUF427 domain-containing protein [Gemmatimonadetes bacterium]|nr:DUF427 domain-containing protein [Gemmatimonadota bacterium]